MYVATTPSQPRPAWEPAQMTAAIASFSRDAGQGWGAGR
jgi:hypothetical protein